MQVAMPMRVDGGKLRELRNEAELSQEQLARRARVSHMTIHRLESGTTLLAREVTIWAIAMALGVDATDLLATGQNPDTLPGAGY